MGQPKISCKYFGVDWVVALVEYLKMRFISVDFHLKYQSFS